MESWEDDDDFASGAKSMTAVITTTALAIVANHF
jgi:hypothetical protein